MMNLVDVLVTVARENPGLTAAELYEALGRSKSKARGEPYVLAALKGRPDLFRCDAPTGGWYLCTNPYNEVDVPVGSPAVTENPRSSIGSSRELAETPNEQNDPTTIEQELRRRLVGRRVIAEVGLDEETHQRVESALRQLLSRTRNLGRIAQSYPALLATYLVGHGVYRYEAGNFYGTASLAGIDQSAGPAFMDAVRRLGLESFEDLVVGENALRYVGPMLAHGGIPRYCLDDYFNLILRDMERVGGDATELLSFWRTRKSAFFGIDAPVRRFLLYGGELARDVLDRTLDMVDGYSSSDSLPRSTDLGLPPYIVEGFRQRGEKHSVPSRRSHRRVARPQISLDPWTTAGPQLLLPSVPGDMDAFWRIQADGLLDRVRASSYESRQIQLSPAKAWTVTLTDGAATVSEISIEGMDELPALFFDPDDGSLLGPGAGLRLDDVWILGPREAELHGVDPSGTNVPLSDVEQLPDPTGTWSGFALRHVSLRGLRAISIRKQAGAPERRITVRPPAERARILGTPIPNVATVDGLPVFARFPEVELPQGTALGRSDWRIRVAVDGEWDNRDAANLPDGAEGLRVDAAVPHERPSRIWLVIQGPLGSDLRVAFLFVPGLEVTSPQRVILPRDRHGTVTVMSPAIPLDVAAAGEQRTLLVGDEDDTVRFTVAPEGSAPLVLVAQVPKLMWGVRRPASAEVVVANRTVSIAADELRNREATGLTVRVGIRDVPLSFSLLDGDRILQTTEQVLSSGGGRWVFDLSRFADTAVMSDSPLLDIRLTVAGRYVTAIHVRRSLHVGNLRPHAVIDGECTTVEVEFDEDRPVRNRVVRLWSCARIWAAPIVEFIPDGQKGRAKITRYEDIPFGEYLVELAVDDGWTAVRRPDRNSPGVAHLQVGTADDIRNRLDRLSLVPPLNVAEIAAATGSIPRDLTNGELKIVVPALLDTTAEILHDPGAPELTSGRFTAIRELLLADTVCFADAVVNAIELGRLDFRALAPLAVGLGHNLAPPLGVDHEEFDASMAALWEVGPCLAAGLDVKQDPDEPQAARYRRYLGWDPSDGPGAIETGSPVEQMFVGMSMETLEAIAVSIGLVPDRVLTLDALVQANFEWLLAGKRGDAPRRWWQQWKHLVREAHETFGKLANVHLDARVPPPGTEGWAGLPGVTLAAALHLFGDTRHQTEATRALLTAMPFAPLLVSRDLVLARVLLLEYPAHQTEVTL